MNNTPGPLLNLEAFVLLVFAAGVGGVVATLVYVSGMGLPQAVIAGGAAVGASLLWAMALTRPRR